MPSPFPGMDPYIESDGRWRGFHLMCCAEAVREFDLRLSPRYVAEIHHWTWLRMLPADAETDRVRRDVDSRKASSVPFMVRLPALEPESMRHVRIIEAATDRVVTVIELLGPDNKTPGAGREACLVERTEYLHSQVNFVEMDLLKGGVRPALGVRLRLADRLPVIPIPLAPDEADVPMNLRDCPNRAYDAGRYGSLLKYRRPLPVPPWKQTDADWAAPFAAAVAASPSPGAGVTREKP